MKYIVMHTLTTDERSELIDLGERIVDLIARCVEVREELIADGRQREWMDSEIAWACGLINTLHLVLIDMNLELWRYKSTLNEATNAQRQIAERIAWLYKNKEEMEEEKRANQDGATQMREILLEALPGLGDDSDELDFLAREAAKHW